MDVRIYSKAVEDLLGATPPTQDSTVRMDGAYEASSRIDRDLALYAPSLKSADVEILPEKDMMDRRVRDMSRNDAYVAGGVTLHQDNIVGSAFILNSKPSTTILGLDDVWATEFQEEVEEKFTYYADDNSNNWIDAARTLNFTEMIRLGTGLSVVGGEILASAEWRKDPSRPYNTTIQMIDTDRLSNPDYEMDSDSLRGGIEFDSYGAPLFYNIRMAHPVDFTYSYEAYTWKRIPIRKPWGRIQMIHIFEQNRPAQSRGIAAMVAALKEMRITKKFRDITLQSAVVNATYAASIESDLPDDVVFQALGGGQVNPAAITDYATAYLGAIAKFSGNSKNNHLDGAKIPHFFPGTKLNIRNVGTPGGVGTQFEESLLRYIAAILGVSYEELSRDYTKTNYSSARAAMNNTWKHMQGRKKRFADRFANYIYALWLEEAINKKDIQSMPRKAPNWYEGLNAVAYSAADWIGASRGQIDEWKETQAAVMKINNNLSTCEEEIGKLGRDWRKVFRQRAREKQLAEKLGITVLMPGPGGTGNDSGSNTDNNKQDKNGAANE